MFGFPGTWKIYLAVEPVDMRKQYDGLNSDIGVKPVIPTCGLLRRDQARGGALDGRGTRRARACRDNWGAIEE